MYIIYLYIIYLFMIFFEYLYIIDILIIVRVTYTLPVYYLFVRYWFIFSIIYFRFHELNIWLIFLYLGISNPVAFGLQKSQIAHTQPMCLQILPPLQLCNIVSQPLLYRIADKDGYVTSEVRKYLCTCSSLKWKKITQ